jgi:hypothetical protein
MVYLQQLPTRTDHIGIAMIDYRGRFRGWIDRAAAREIKLYFAEGGGLVTGKVEALSARSSGTLFGSLTIYAHSVIPDVSG